MSPSPETGRRILELASKKVVAELGGKNPMIIFEDADVDAAVEGGEKGYLEMRWNCPSSTLKFTGTFRRSSPSS